MSVFGSLCVETCSRATDCRHYCQVGGGGSEECGPGPGTTPQGEQCADQCSKRGDQYYWCQRQDKPWDYCSPPLVFQQDLRCPEDAERSTVPDPSECARYLSCEAGLVKLEECPEGLHYIHRNRSCEWPTGGPCGDVFARSDSQTTEDRILQTIKRIRFPTPAPAPVYTNIQSRANSRSALTPTSQHSLKHFSRRLFSSQNTGNNIGQPGQEGNLHIVY